MVFKIKFYLTENHTFPNKTENVKLSLYSYNKDCKIYFKGRHLYYIVPYPHIYI